MATRNPATEEEKREKRARGEGTEPKFNEKIGRWEQRFGYRDSKTGRQKVKAIYGESRQEVIQKAKAWHKDQDNGVDKNRGKMSFEDWLNSWLDTYKRGHVEETSVHQYYKQINNYIVPALGGLKLKEITRQVLQEFINEKRTDLSSASLGAIRGVLSDSLKAAVEEDILLKNPATGLKIPKDKAVQQKEITPYTKEEMTAILNKATKRPTLAMLIELDAHTGMRRGEVCGLRWTDVDTKNKIIHVRQQLKIITVPKEEDNSKTKNIYKVTAGPLKTKNARRDIPIDDRLVLLLKKHKAWQPKPSLATEEEYKKTRSSIYR